MPKVSKGLLLVLMLGLVIWMSGSAYAQDPEGNLDTVYAVIDTTFYPDSAAILIRLNTDNTGLNQVAGMGMPFLIKVGSNFARLDTSTARTFAGSAVNGWAVKVTSTDATGGADPTVSPVEFVIGGVDFSGGLAAGRGILLATFKLHFTGGRPSPVEIDSFHTGTIKDLTLTTASAVDFTPGWVPAKVDAVKEVKGEPSAIPNSFALGQNYPNPFNATTLIQFNLPKTSNVKLEIFNVLGQKVRTLVDEVLQPGYKQVIWDGKDQSGRQVASGVYFYRIKAKDLFTDMKKMVLLK